MDTATIMRLTSDGVIKKRKDKEAEEAREKETAKRKKVNDLHASFYKKLRNKTEALLDKSLRDIKEIAENGGYEYICKIGMTSAPKGKCPSFYEVAEEAMENIDNRGMYDHLEKDLENIFLADFLKTRLFNDGFRVKALCENTTLTSEQPTVRLIIQW